MIYLSKFKFQDSEQETSFLFSQRRTCFDTWYPFGILTKHAFRQIDFEPVTIIYGGNGSGKSTALNVICEKLGLERDTLYNRSNFYEDYLNGCSYETEKVLLYISRIKSKKTRSTCSTSPKTACLRSDSKSCCAS